MLRSTWVENLPQVSHYGNVQAQAHSENAPVCYIYRMHYTYSDAVKYKAKCYPTFLSSK